TPTWCRPPQTSRPGPPSAPITRRMAPSASSKPCRPVPRAVSTAPCSSPDPGVWLKTQRPSQPSLFVASARGRAKPPKATPRPYTRHILGIDSGVQSHTKATPRLHQGYTKATPRLHQGYTKATPKPHQGQGVPPFSCSSGGFGGDPPAHGLWRLARNVNQKRHILPT